MKHKKDEKKKVQRYLKEAVERLRLRTIRNKRIGKTRTIKLTHPQSIMACCLRLLRNAKGRAKDAREKSYLDWGMRHIKDEEKVARTVVLNREVFDDPHTGKAFLFICKNGQRIHFSFDANADKGPRGFRRPTLMRMPDNSTKGTVVPRTNKKGEKTSHLAMYDDSNDYRDRPRSDETMPQYRSRARWWRKHKMIGDR